MDKASRFDVIWLYETTSSQIVLFKTVLIKIQVMFLNLQIISI